MTRELTMQLFDRFAAGGRTWHWSNATICGTRRPPRLAEALVWVGNRAIDPEAAEFSLVVSPVPCVYRKRATAALDAARIAWRIAYTCVSVRQPRGCSGRDGHNRSAQEHGAGQLLFSILPARNCLFPAYTEIALLELSGNRAGITVARRDRRRRIRGIVSLRLSR